MRCELERCRGVLDERIDRLGRISFICHQCERRKRGMCRMCPRPVDGKKGVAFYCALCRKKKTRESVMRWQRNNLDIVAKGARRRRYAAKGKAVPQKMMTRSERGKIGGKLGSAARIKKLGPERVAEIARIAREARWKKYYEQKQREGQ